MGRRPGWEVAITFCGHVIVGFVCQFPCWCVECNYLIGEACQTNHYLTFDTYCLVPGYRMRACFTGAQASKDFFVPASPCCPSRQPKGRHPRSLNHLDVAGLVALSHYEWTPFASP